MRKFKVKVNGKEYEVEIEEIVSDAEDKTDEFKADTPDFAEEKSNNETDKA